MHIQTLPTFLPPTAQEKWAIEQLHGTEIAGLLREIEELDNAWERPNEPYPPRLGRYMADEAIRGWSIPRTTALHLYSIITATKATHGLEIGTSFGYSAIWLASALSKNGGKLVSCEIYVEKIAKATDFIARSGLDNITVEFDDALAFMKHTRETFDFVFLDADAADYIDYLSWLRKLMRSGGILAMDNLFTHMEVVSEFVDRIRSDPHWSVWWWPYDSGLMLARRT